MKRFMLFLFLFPLAVLAQVPSYPVRVDLQSPSRTFKLTWAAGSSPVLAAYVSDGGRSFTNLSGWTGYVYVAVTPTAGVYVAASPASSNRVNFAFTASQTATVGTFGVEIVLGNGTNTYRWGTGSLSLSNSPALLGAGTVPLTGIFNWDLFSFTGTPPALSASYTNALAGDVTGAPGATEIADDVVGTNNLTPEVRGMLNGSSGNFLQNGTATNLKMYGGSGVVESSATGSVQAGWFKSGTSTIYGLSLGAQQIGYFIGANVISNSFGARQVGTFFGTNIIEGTSVGAFQSGRFNGSSKIIDSDGAFQIGWHDPGSSSEIRYGSYGAYQSGRFYRQAIISQGAIAASQVGKFSHDILIGTNAIGAVQRGESDSSSTATNLAIAGSQYISLVATSSAFIAKEANGAVQIGYLGGGSIASNEGPGSVQLLALTNGQRAVMRGRASLSLGAIDCTNDASIAAAGRVIASEGFFGPASGLTDIPPAWTDSTNRLGTVGGVGSNLTFTGSTVSTGTLVVSAANVTSIVIRGVGGAYAPSTRVVWEWTDSGGTSRYCSSYVDAGGAPMFDNGTTAGAFWWAGNHTPSSYQTAAGAASFFRFVSPAASNTAAGTYREAFTRNHNGTNYLAIYTTNNVWGWTTLNTNAFPWQ